MKTPLWPILLRELPGIAAVVVLLVALFAHRSALQDRDEWIDAANDHLARLSIMDRLIGTLLPDAYVADSTGTHVDLGELAKGGGVWILAPDECAGCLEDVGEWNIASLTGGTQLTIVFTGVSVEKGRHLASIAGVRFPFAVDEHGVLRQTLGLSLASTHLAVATDGTVVMVDAGSEEMRCRPGFPSRLKYMDGHPNWHGVGTHGSTDKAKTQ